jgi:deoxyribose-phosphate aldolase
MAQHHDAFDRTTVARLLDHTILKPEATRADVARLCEEAVDLAVCAVCVSPSMLPLPDGLLAGSFVKTCTVVGFPSGAHQARHKAAEAALAVDQGADEVDMVIDLGLAVDGRWDDVRAEIGLVRASVPSPLVLKVIIESAALSPEQIVEACRAAEDAGADFVKTSTGFHPSGGASVEAVRLMADTVGGRLGVKASGGIRSAETAVAMLSAGATRLGTSSSAAILAGL